MTRSTTTTMTETLDYDPTTTTTEKKQNVRSDVIRVVQSLRFSTTQYDYVQFGQSLVKVGKGSGLGPVEPNRYFKSLLVCLARLNVIRLNTTPHAA